MSSPVKDTVVTNDRWGKETICAHGGYFTCTDRYNPGNVIKTIKASCIYHILYQNTCCPILSSYLLISGKLQKHKWENAMTIDKYSWGYRRNALLSDHLTITDMLKMLAETVRSQFIEFFLSFICCGYHLRYL